MNGGDASIGGFATDKIANLADYVLDGSTDLNADYRRASWIGLLAIRPVANVFYH